MEDFGVLDGAPLSPRFAARGMDGRLDRPVATPKLAEHPPERLAGHDEASVRVLLELGQVEGHAAVVMGWTPESMIFYK